MGVLYNIIESPLRAVIGALGGMSDGFRGHIDENERFSDGKSEDNPAKKSRAGSVLSDYAGVRGGEKLGVPLGALGMGLGAGIMTGHFLLSTSMLGLGVAGFPVFAGAVATLAAVAVGAAIGSVVGKHVGRVLGAAAGMAGGAVVGAYSAIFKRGYYADPKPPKPDVAVSTDTPLHSVREAKKLAKQEVVSPVVPAQEDISYSRHPSPPPTPGFEGRGFAGRVAGSQQRAAASASQRG